MNALGKFETAVTPNYGIAELISAEQLLERVQSLPEARDLIASAQALKMFMKKADLGYANQNRAAAVAIKARRKAGEMVKLIERKAGARTEPRGATPAGSTPLQQSMDDLNVTHKTVGQWQRLADETTEAEIDEKAAEFTAAQAELTTEACLPPKSGTPEKREELQQAVDAMAPIARHPANGVLDVFERAAEGIAALPSAQECARTLPAQLRHSVSLMEYRLTIMWLKQFCDEWKKIEEGK